MSCPPLVIGRGAMGEVYLATYQGKTVVVKKSQRDVIDNTLLKEYSNYFKLQDHNNILKFYGVIRDDRYSFSLVLEYAPNGNLSSYLKTHTVGWSFKARVCRDIACGLMHCHDNNVLHFDLKPENILLDQALIPKLADFGISKSKSQMILDNGKAGGTINYVAPERVCRDIKMREFFDNHPKLSDIYSFGLILWSVAKSGEHPYEGVDDEDIKEQKRSAHSIYRLLNQLPDHTPQNYHQLIFDLTKYNPCERLELAVARLELESMFDDDDEERHMSRHYDLDIDELDDDDDDYCENEENSVAGSVTVSTSTTIESDKPSEKEINVYSENLVESSSCEIINDNKPSSNIHHSSRSSRSSRSSVPSRKSSKQSSYSESSTNTSKNNNYKGGTILADRSLVASPISNIDKNPVVEIPTIPSLDSMSFISNIYEKISGNSRSGRHNKHDSGVAGMVDQKSQTTLVGSPTTPKNEDSLLKSKISTDDLSLINDVITICDNWEKYTDDVMRRKLEVLCHEKGIKPKGLFEIFAKNQFRSPHYYFIIGFMNEHAFGKEKDPQMAFNYYHKAADLGDPRGLVYVGWCYYKGMGTSKDPQKAFNCFQRAANNGSVSAHNNVGWCYDIGFGTSTDPYKAFECFKSSAEKGYATAQCRVGVCYEYGRGTPKDLEKALEWYTKAAENGHETAKRRVSELTKLIRRGHRRRNFLSSLSNLFHY
ncbi:kinase-like domain-containing protein [Rhizophagus clarus]|uniref:Kinase-like domain-containing protein n=1 Tax=Rhizophagus clarus TaxID=94130 RepID=A0A8H3LU60_9GLOM|nr:kinase-like domain-containing protein [Rhizophagus clarus]